MRGRPRGWFCGRGCSRGHAARRRSWARPRAAPRRLGTALLHPPLMTSLLARTGDAGADSLTCRSCTSPGKVVNFRFNSWWAVCASAPPGVRTCSSFCYFIEQGYTQPAEPLKGLWRGEKDKEKKKQLTGAHHLGFLLLLIFFFALLRHLLKGSVLVCTVRLNR